MKLRLLSFFLLLHAALGTRAQIVLNERDVWDYHFTSMNLLSANGIFGSPSGQLTIGIDSFPSGTLKWEVWDGVAIGTPMGSGLITPTAGAGIVGAWSFAWQDFEGSVRLTMLTGSCTVASVRANATRPASLPSRWDTFTSLATSNSPPPRLLAQRLTNAVAVSWWTNGTTGYVLESANAIPTNQWTVVPLAPVVVSNRYVVNVATNESAAYFRLRK
jgi:hypothetical protein